MTRTITFAAALAFIGCADATEPTPREEPSSLEIGKADGVDYDNWTYFMVSRVDTRRCVAPLCGGVYVKRINQPETKCADGKWARECYVGGFDFAAIGYTPDEEANARQAIYAGGIFRGEIVTNYYPGDFAKVPAFAASEVWVSALGGTPKNIFYRAHDLGIMCFAEPCADTAGLRLNRNLEPLQSYAGLDWSKTDADDGILEKAIDKLLTDEIIVAAKPYDVSGAGGHAERLRVNQIYFALRPAQEAGGQACGGRAGACPEGLYCQFGDALCGKADGQGTCQVPPTACTKVYNPVCGCDGETYGNDCMRMMAGAGYGTPGECEAKPKSCVIGGCSAEKCIEEGSGNGVSVCLWQDSYACYADATCEVQPDGNCGWTETVELTNCLEGSR